MEELRRVVDPWGREVVFDHESWLHLAVRRPWLLDHLDAVLAAIAFPEHHSPDPRAGRERFHARHPLLPWRWLRVIVDYEHEPAVVVSAVEDKVDPRSYR